MIDIKDIQGNTRFSTGINPGAKGKFSLMKEDYVVLPFNTLSPVDFQVGDYVDLRGVLDASMGGKLAKIYQIVDIPYRPTRTEATPMNFVLTLTISSGKQRYSSTPRSTEDWKRPGPLPLHWMSRWVYSFAI